MMIVLKKEKLGQEVQKIAMTSKFKKLNRLEIIILLLKKRMSFDKKYVRLTLINHKRLYRKI